MDPAADEPTMIPEEHEHSHGHKTGIPWLDIILAGSAMVVSVISLSVSIHHGQVMQSLVDANTRMVAASTLPILNYGTSNLDDSGNEVASLDVRNGGVGPATVDWLDLTYKGQPVTDFRAFLQACCDAADSGWATQGINGRVLTAGEKIGLLFVPRRNMTNDAWARLDAARSEVSARACYCSVLEECWVTDFQQTRPQRVTTCKAARSGDMTTPTTASH